MFLIFDGIKAQNSDYSPTISAFDSAYLLSVPEYPLSNQLSRHKSSDLPYKTDNSQLPFFRPVISQIGWECHIFNGICYNLTYELNRLRNLPGDLPENQLPSHFVLNFINEGEYENSSNIIRGWEVARNAGSPHVADYGGVNYGGSTRWMSGYEKYYHSMFNRVDRFYSLDVRTVDGLETLKHWIYNHMDEGEYGSLANCVVAGGNVIYDTLAPGTEEEGKVVVAAWGPWPGHSITIVGYNDSIRYDYNNDGQYTNNIDINGDGIVNLKDWEIGAFKVANSFGPEWGDEGFAYMMYRLLALNTLDGGLWANRVYILDAREHDPLLTIKMNLKHDSRNKLKISAGVSTDISSILPEYIHDFYIFNYQGGDRYMQGGTDEESKYIETGLDITPLLSHIESGEQAKFFLMINEKDPEGLGTGEIIDFAILDYTAGIEEIIYPAGNIPLQENSLTQLSLMHTVNYDEVQITTGELGDAFAEEPYSAQLTADLGLPPYRWNILHQYDQEQTTQTFPMITDEKLLINSGYAVKDLFFDFPFFDSVYNTLRLSPDGSIHFGDVNPYPFSLIVDNSLYLRHLKTVMPFFTKARLLTYGESGIWYQGNENDATFRWRTMVDGMEGSEMNFAVRLFSSGQIDFFYGDMVFPDTVNWCSGISYGDALNVFNSNIEAISSFTNGFKISFVPQDFPMGMKIHEDGFFSGTPGKDTIVYSINFLVKDSRDIVKSKQFQFKVTGSDSILEKNIPDLELMQNYPNPLSDYTWFDFSVNEESLVNLSLFNVEGIKVTTLVNTTLTADHYHILWKGVDNHHHSLPNGIYFYTLTAGEKQVTKKLLILK
ncbi:MAG: T9SS type A sorting domain-containing protein [Bacteroidales bacterium]|nr:T9SS type A sorting domain-containing protein [Bacteroidales bacterium]